MSSGAVCLRQHAFDPRKGATRGSSGVVRHLKRVNARLSDEPSRHR